MPPELIFGGHGVGELFVARDAGNLVDLTTLGTIEYGAAVLGSPLIVVLAHTACGAVKAACDVVTKNATYPGVDRPDDRADRAGGACGAQRPRRLRRQHRQGERQADRGADCPSLSTILGDLVDAGKVKIVAAIYDLQTGVVTYLD